MSVDSVTVRSQLERIVEADLLGPWDGDEEELIGDEGPRSRYLIGMLAPRDATAGPELLDSSLGDSDDDEGGVDRPSPSAAATMFAHSCGVSFAVPLETQSVAALVRWGRYVKEASERQFRDDGLPRTVYRRRPVEGRVEISINEGRRRIAPVPWDVDDVRLDVTCNRRRDRWVVELALINDQPQPKRRPDEAWLFQVALDLTALDGKDAIFLPQEWSEDAAAPEPEEAHLRLLFRDALEYSVGRNVAAHVEARPGERRAHQIQTTWMPAFDIPQTVAPSLVDQPGLAGLELDMSTLATLHPAELRRVLLPLVDGYEGWLSEQEERLVREAELASHLPAARSALQQARLAAQRIRLGIDLVGAESGGIALEAFRFANRAMALQRVHTEAGRIRTQEPSVSFEQALTRVDSASNRSWRPFQLAFVLLNLPGLTDAAHPERSSPHESLVDLLYFPTGGGKTEAYLGLTAYTLATRRLQGVVGMGQQARDGSDGMAVLMRYTLRLLTAQQFQRAAAMICACEVLRQERIAAGDPRWGEVPFRIGLWVGLGVTPNWFEDADEQIRRARQRGKGAGNQVLQLLACPWCSEPLDESRDLEPRREERRVFLYCSDPDGRCPFSRRNAPNEGLPILTVDEEIYRLAPAMVVATVDKLAQLPWRGQAAMLFGLSDRRCSRHGYRHPDLDRRTKCTDSHRATDRLPGADTTEVTRLRPPDLIIQDELHLISGALGTMVGLYETMVDHLCTWQTGDQIYRPKIISSTATVRRAAEQVHQLFSRRLQIFPPPVLDATDTFFSLQVPVTDASPGRRYRGICAHGIRLKQAEIRIAESVLTAAQYLFDQNGVAADPYMTYVGYFNAIRELAGMKRLVDDDISVRVRRGHLKGLADRQVPMEVQELTSRTSSSRIAETLRQLDVPTDPAYDSTAARSDRTRTRREGRRPIDVLLATSMLQVGVDVSRLGLMVVTGQPKSAAEYIQATSRVGRDPARPGLVLTLYNWARARDLAHFETFDHYHQTFYRRVEALSVTPFSRRAVDRGLTGVLVAMIRAATMAYSPNPAAQNVSMSDPLIKQIVNAIVARAGAVSLDSNTAAFVRDAVQARLDSWVTIRHQLEAARLGYRSSGDLPGLLREASLGRWDLWTVANSLRETEPDINLLLPRDTVVDRTMSGLAEWTYGPAASASSEEENDGLESSELEAPDAAPAGVSAAAKAPA